MTSKNITDLNILDIYIWPAYQTAEAASYEYGANIRDALQRAGAIIETNESLAARAWFNSIEELKLLSQLLI